MNTTITYFLSSIYLQIGELVEDVFEIGFWAAIIVIVLVVLLIGWFIKKIRR